MNRRNAIKAGVIGSAVLATCGYLSEPLWSRYDRSDEDLEILTKRDQSALTPVIDFFLAGNESPPAYSHAQILRNLDQAIAGFPDALQTESVQLLSLMQSRIFTGLSGGHWKPLSDSSAEEISSLLLNWRNSKVIFVRSCFHGLQELIMSAWFADESVWSEFGYPGPPTLFS